MTNLKTIFTFLYISIVAWPLTTVDADSSDDQISCEYQEGYKANLPTNLTALQQQAIEIGQEICLSSLIITTNENIDISPRLIRFASGAREALDAMYPDSVFPGLSGLSETWFNQVTDTDNDYRNFALVKATNITTGIPPRNSIEFKLDLSPNSKIIFESSNTLNAHCKSLIDQSGIDYSQVTKDCKNSFNLWSNAVTPFQFLYSDRVLKNNGEKLFRLQDRWKRFVEDARYQTPLDVWATTRWHSEQFKSKHLTGPPSTQLFLLHPTIVYEHIPDAEKGSREDVSVAIEWAGINWWENGFGISITSIYKDRSTQPSVGTGLTFHVQNKYSFGYVKRSNGDDSLFFNVDLLEWFGDKKEKYNKYRKYFD